MVGGTSMSFVELKKDRLTMREEGLIKKVFLEKGMYSIHRKVEGLGYLIRVGGTNKKPILSLIRSENV